MQGKQRIEYSDVCLCVRISNSVNVIVLFCLCSLYLYCWLWLCFQFKYDLCNIYPSIVRDAGAKILFLYSMFVLFILLLFYRYKMSNDCVIVVDHRQWIHHHNLLKTCLFQFVSSIWTRKQKEGKKNISTSISIFTSIHLLFYFGTICCIDSLIVIWPQFRSICVYSYHHY